jgi:hypothetical protein
VARRMTQTMTAVPVTSCSVEDCSFNCDRTCHATEVSVGDVHQTCDTFTVSAASICDGQGRVTRCLVEDCAHNDKAACCTAPAVGMRRHSAHADCATFSARA